MKSIKINLDIEPLAWSRVGETIIQPKRGGKPFIHHYTPKSMADYQAEIQNQIRKVLPGDWRPLDIPLVVDIIFYLKSPQKPLFAVPATKPDDENLSKNVSDAFNGLIWRDDCRVVDRRIRKLYSPTGKGYTEVIIMPWAPGDNFNEIGFSQSEQLSL